MQIRRPSVATIVASTALFVALGGPAEAQRALSIKNNSVTSAKIKNKTIKLADLATSTVRLLRVPADNTVTGKKVVDGSLSGLDLAQNSINGDRLAANSVGSATVVDNSIVTGDIAADAIDTQEIRDRSIRDNDIGTGQITNSLIASGSLTGAKLGRYSGTLVDLGFSATIDKGACSAVTSTGLTSTSTANQDLRDDVIVVTPPEGLNTDNLSITARPQGANQIRVSICNVGSAAPAAVGTRTLNYLSIDIGGG